MRECINHPGKDGVYRCARCRRYFCPVCVELIGDKAYCYECLKEIVKESRENIKKSLTLRVGVSSIVALMIALMSLHNSVPALMYVYNNPSGMYEPFSNALIINAFSFVMGLAFLFLSIGLATTAKWTYNYGMVISAVNFIVELLKILNSRGGIELILSNPQSDATAFFIIMVVGSLMLFIAILGSRKELLGW
jgi:hypothetical protein